MVLNNLEVRCGLNSKVAILYMDDKETEQWRFFDGNVVKIIINQVSYGINTVTIHHAGSTHPLFFQDVVEINIG